MLSSRPLAAALAIVVLLVLAASVAEVEASRLPSTAVLGRQALPAIPPKPTIRGAIVGKRVRIAYSFSTWPSDPNRQPVQLITAVQASEARYAPYVKQHMITARHGTVWQPLGLGTAPFTLRAAAYARTGRRSPIVIVHLRGG